MALVSQRTWGGLVVSTDPSSLPEGASPRCWDVDFVTGGWRQRPGQQNVYTFGASLLGPNPAFTAVDTPVGNTPWLNPGNILLNGVSYATATPTSIFPISGIQGFAGRPLQLGTIQVTFQNTLPPLIAGQTYTFNGLTAHPALNGQVLAPLSVAGNVGVFNFLTGNFGPQSETGNGAINTSPVSDYLDVTDFTFSAPLGQSITGIQIALHGYSNGGQTAALQLLAGGLALDQPKAAILPASPGITPFGGQSDQWQAALTSAIVNETSYGVRIQAQGAGTCFLNYVTMTVYLTASNANFNAVWPILSPTGVKYNLALDSNGTWWNDNGTSTLTQSLAGTVPNTFARAETIYDRAFVSQMTLLGQVTGADIPRQYNYEGGWWDRITQAGPGAPPTVAAAQSSAAISSVTSVSFSGTIATITANNSYVAGEVGTFSGLTGGAAGLNAQTLIVLSTGLSPTGFQVASSIGAGGPFFVNGLYTPQYTYPIATITQPPQMSDPNDPGHINTLLWSAGPGSTSAGNTITVYYSDSFVNLLPDTILVNAFNAGFPVYVYITNAPFGNGIWQVTSVGNAIPPGAGYYRWYFTFQVPTSNYQKYGGPDTATGFYQVTQATVTLASPVPGLAPGSQVSIAGASVPAWNSTYPIVEALNSGSFNITQSSIAGGVATYSWTLTSGAAPAAGEQVTITNTLNANGVLNVADAVIASSSGVSSGTFTISGFALNLNFPVAVEEGQATTAGTQFIIDPGAANAGSTSVNPIFGNSTGGTLTIVGAAAAGTLPIGAGTRQVVQYFVTRNGGGYAVSAPVTVDIPLGSNYIQAGLLIGPPNVIARGIAVTQAGQNGVAGANFYTSTVPTTFTVGNVTYISSSFLVADNTTTVAKFTFSDAVLLQSEAIDIPGNNWFELIEIGNPAWLFKYEDQTFYGACQNKLQNFTNLSFDGGYWQPSGGAALPAGWNVDPSYSFPFGAQFTVTGFSITGNIVTIVAANTLSAGLNVVINGLSTGTYLNGQVLNVLTASGTQFTAAFAHANVGSTSDSGSVASICTTISLRTSPVFGNSLYVQNQTAATQSKIGMITQSAYQDAYNVPILNPAGIPIPYSVRVTCRNPSGITGSGFLNIDFTNSNNGVYAATLAGAQIPLAQMSTQMKTFTIPIVIEGISPVEPGLLLRMWGSNMPALADYEIDRIEIFPTTEPVLTNTVYVSYPGEPEQVDQIDGQLTLNSQSEDPAYGATIIHNQIVFKKAHSIVECESSPNLQPAQWTTREVSLRGTGAVGPNAFAQGDEWDIGLSKEGFYVYSGGQPMPISRELQGLPNQAQFWDQFNWNACQTFWLAHDLRTRRFMAGMCMTTPNFWLPNAPVNLNPTTPNVVMWCNYDGVPTPQELEGASPVHVTMFGSLKALDMRRKWSIQNITCPFAGIVNDPAWGYDTIFMGSGIGTGKIYRLVDCSLQPSDDGTQISPLYTTSPFPDPEKAQSLGIGLGQKYAAKWMANIAGLASANQMTVRHYQNFIPGLWNAATLFAPQSIVFYEGSLWGAITPQLGVAPASPSWIPAGPMVTAAFMAALFPQMANNIEWRKEVRGQRIFTEIGLNQGVEFRLKSWISMNELTADFTMHPWGIWRGASS